MNSVLKFVKKHLILLITILILFGCSLANYWDYEQNYQNQVKNYYSILDYCENNPERKNLCETLQYPERDSIYVVFNGMQNNGVGGEGIAGKIQFILFALVVVAGIWDFQKNFSHGILKNKLSRQKYSIVIKKAILSSYKAAFLLPIYMIFLWLAGLCYTTNLSPNIELMSLSAMKDSFSNFSIFYIMYFFIQIIVYFLVSVYMINLGLILVKKSKNFILTVIKSYALFLVLDAFFSFFVSDVLFPFWFNLKLDPMYLNTFSGYSAIIIGNWWVFLLIYGVLAILSYFIVLFMYSNKEKVVIESEK
ncbi:MAG: hypothetical protein E7168_04405 [Firmicutes bacterium]|nr:hypothetical protein [Bacillota bacterium]